MDLALSPAQASLLDRARAFRREVIEPAVPHVREWIVDPGTRFPWDIVEEGSRRGLRTLTVPAAYGGEDVGTLGLSLAVEELAAGDMGVAVIFDQVWKIADTIAQLATPEQAAAFLPGFVGDHRAFVAIGVAEPDHGDRRPHVAAAVGGGGSSGLPLDDGGARRRGVGDPGPQDDAVARQHGVDGSRDGPDGAGTWHPGRMLLLPRADRYAGAPGRHGLGEDQPAPRRQRGADLRRLPGARRRLDRWPREGTRSPDDRRGEHRGGGHHDRQRSRRLRAAVGWARRRVQGGRPLVEHQAIGLLLAEMATDLESARALTHKAAMVFDGGDTTTPLQYMAKWQAAEAAVRVCTKAMEVFGGKGILIDNGPAALPGLPVVSALRREPAEPAAADRTTAHRLGRDGVPAARMRLR